MSLLPQITVRGRICRNIRKKAFTEPNPILLSVLSNCSQPGPGSIEGRKVSGEKMALKSISRDADGERGRGSVTCASTWVSEWVSDSTVLDRRDLSRLPRISPTPDSYSDIKQCATRHYRLHTTDIARGACERKYRHPRLQ